MRKFKYVDRKINKYIPNDGNATQSNIRKYFNNVRIQLCFIKNIK